MNLNQFRISFSVLTVAFLIAPQVLFAANYNPNNIISDEEFQDKDSMSRNFIQEFLEKKGSHLATILVGDKKPSDMFYDAAQSYGINPKVLIATAQKEQSAVTDDELSQRQQEELMGYGVYKGNNWEELKGIDKQIDSAAWQFRRYIDRHGNYPFEEGVSKQTSDGKTVTPENKATSGLYNYTPYAGCDTSCDETDTGAGGNFLFWKVYQAWFMDDRPSGTLIQQVDDAGVYLLKNGKKYPFWYKAVFESFGYKKNEIVTISKEEMEGYEMVAPVKLPTGILIRSPKGTVYIIDGETRRGFADRSDFDRLGYSMDAVNDMRWGIVNLYEEGVPIDSTVTVHAQGTLVKSPHDGGVYQIWDGKKRAIRHLSIFNANFSWDRVIEVSAEQFDQYPFGEPVKFRDGSLIRDENGVVYVIEWEKKRAIANLETFQKMGYNMQSVIDVPNDVADLHESGEDIQSF